MAAKWLQSGCKGPTGGQQTRVQCGELKQAKSRLYMQKAHVRSASDSDGHVREFWQGRFDAVLDVNVSAGEGMAGVLVSHYLIVHLRQ